MIIYLEVTGGLVSEFICSRHGDVFEIPDGNRSPIRIERKHNFTGSVRHVDAFASFVKVDHVVFLFVHQLDHVTLRTAQLWRCFI